MSPSPTSGGRQPPSRTASRTGQHPSDSIQGVRAYLPKDTTTTEPQEEREKEEDSGDNDKGFGPNPGAGSTMLTDPPSIAIRDASHTADMLQALSDYLRSANFSDALAKA